MNAIEYRESRWKSELEFEGWVIDVLHVNGFIVSSMKDSRKQHWKADSGIPDIIAARSDPPKFILAELKIGKNAPTDKQALWLTVLTKIMKTVPGLSQMILVEVWYPSAEDYIVAVAGGKLPT